MTWLRFPVFRRQLAERGVRVSILALIDLARDQPGAWCRRQRNGRWEFDHRAVELIAAGATLDEVEVELALTESSEPIVDEAA